MEQKKKKTLHLTIGSTIPSESGEIEIHDKNAADIIRCTDYDYSYENGEPISIDFAMAVTMTKEELEQELKKADGCDYDLVFDEKRIRFVFKGQVIQITGKPDGEETGEYRLAAGKPVLYEEKNVSDVCPESIVKAFRSYYMERGRWPIIPEELLQWGIGHAGGLPSDWGDGGTAYDRIQAVIDLQNEARFLYIESIPASGARWQENIKDILCILKELQSVQVCENKRGLFSRDGILYQKLPENNKKIEACACVVEFCPLAWQQTEICLDPSVQVIARMAFWGNRKLEKVVITGNQAEIRPSAFLHCPALREVRLSEGSIVYCTVSAFDEGSAVYKALLAEWISDSGYNGALENVVCFGRCGENTWRYTDRENTEHVIGTGEMWDREPWPGAKQSLHFGGCRLIIHDGVTSLGKYAFDMQNFDSISFAGSIREVRRGAFCWMSRGPEKIIFTGENPPEDWLVWLRSDLFAYENTVLYLPEKWRSAMTHSYFESIREKIREDRQPPQKTTIFDLDLKDRTAFIDDLEKEVYKEAKCRFRWI